MTGLQAQILTSSPYSRYGLGEINTQNFAPLNAVGGAFSAYQCDTAMPCFINIANPAALSALRFSTFEVGGQAQFSRISNASNSIKKTNINFSYGSLGFPVGKIGGAAFGIMPYSTVGYHITSYAQDPAVGQIKYVYQGDGGFNKAFLGTGLRPLRRQLQKFYNSAIYDSLYKAHNWRKLGRLKVARQLLSELSLGATGNYIFGSTNQTTDVVLPGSILFYHARRLRTTHVSDISFNTGLQTAFTIDHVMQKKRLVIKDTVNHTETYIDTVIRRDLKQRVKIGFGVYANLPTLLNATQSTIVSSYALDGFGNEIPEDTSLNSSGNKGSIRLPLEIGAGFSVKKGEKLTFLIDGGVTNWSSFRYFSETNQFKSSYRMGLGAIIVPGEPFSNNYLKSIQYRLGFMYSNGYLDLANTRINNYALTVGLGLPVSTKRPGDMYNMVNISAQFGTMGTTTKGLLQEKYIRLVVGFTFNKRWFIKYKYD